MKQPLSKLIILIAIFVFIPFLSFAQDSVYYDETTGRYESASGLESGIQTSETITGPNTTNSGSTLEPQNQAQSPWTSPNNIGSNNIIGSPAPRINDLNSGGKYRPITPGYSSFFTEGTDFGKMVETIFKLSITITIVLAVIMMIVGGIQYMGSESVFAKGAGKDKIYAALGGLLIALVSILMISTILPGGNGGTFEIDIFG